MALMFCTRLGLSVSALLFCLALGNPITGLAMGGSPFQDPKADALAAKALNAFNAGENEFSASQWQELLDKFPDYPNRPQATYNLGLCQTRLDRHEDAIRTFQEAIRILPAASTELLAGAHFFLGYSQLRAGEEKAAADATQSGQLLTTATVTFAKLLDQYPGYANAHEARYYQATAFEQLKRMEEARAGYAAVAADPKATFRQDALYALGELDRIAGQFDSAAKSFREYLKSPGEGRTANEVRFRAAQTFWSLALAAEGRGDQPAFTEQADESRKMLELLNVDETFHMRDQSLFLSAAQASHIGKDREAAELFAAAAAVPDSPGRVRSLLNAGIQFAAAGEDKLAEQPLRTVLQSDETALAAQAAHELSQLLNRSGDPEAAWKIAGEWADKAPNPAQQAELLFDQADAALKIPARKAAARESFLAIAKDFPEAPAAPFALYNAAWATLQDRKPADLATALELCGQFETRYAKHEYLPFILEVKSEAEALSGDSAAAVATLQRLINGFPEHPQSGQWSLTLAAELLRAGKPAEAIPLASQIASQENRAADLRADAWYWVAASKMAAEDLPGATAALAESRKLSRQGKRADLAAFLAAELEAFSDRWPEAWSGFDGACKEFPGSAAAADTAFRVATRAYNQSRFELADQWFSRVIKDYADQEVAVAALAGAGWSRLKLGKPEEAARLFQTVVDKHAGHRLAGEAARGLAVALRTGGDEQAAIAALEKQLLTLPEEADRTELGYELVLALVQAKQPQRVVDEARALLKLPSSKRIADRLNYELAWALQDLKQPDEALAQFQLLTRDFPGSVVSGDAHLQIGEFEYRREQYEAAIPHYRSCLAVKEAPASVREVASYKLGWSLFRQKKYPEAGEQFARSLEEFPAGKYADDSRFMVAETLFMQDQFEAAARSFAEALPVFEASQTLQPANRHFAWLHGAQASNRAGAFEQAIQLATLLTGDEAAPEALRQDAWLEIGNAHKDLKQLDQAVEAWTRAAASLGKTGARAYCLIGDKLFVDRKFDEAIAQYKNVYFGYGGSDPDPELDPWQAYAIYEAALCYTVRIETAPEAQRSELISKATGLFERLLQEHPADRHAGEAKSNLEKLKRLAGGL